MRPELRALWIADPPAAWEALGFSVSQAGALDLGGVRVVLGGEGRGITAWSIEGADGGVDGVRVRSADGAVRAPSGHANGAIGIDHVVVITPDFDRTAAALDTAGMPLRRIRDAGTFRQGFRRLGPAILELVEANEMKPGEARLWGLTLIVSDLDALGALLGDRLRDVKDAVQPGRRIATLDRSAGLSTHVAVMTPEPA